LRVKNMPVIDDRNINTPPYFGPDNPPTNYDLAQLLGSGVFTGDQLIERFKISPERLQDIRELAAEQAAAGSLEDLQDQVE
jgi:hypothetical protein